MWESIEYRTSTVCLLARARQRFHSCSVKAVKTRSHRISVQLAFSGKIVFHSVLISLGMANRVSQQMFWSDFVSFASDFGNSCRILLFPSKFTYGTSLSYIFFQSLFSRGKQSNEIEWRFTQFDESSIQSFSSCTQTRVWENWGEGEGGWRTKCQLIKTNATTVSFFFSFFQMLFLINVSS